MNKLRIALITANYNHIPDGVSLTLNRLVAYLLRTGHEVKIFAPTIENPPIDHAGDLYPITSTISIPGREEYLFAYAFPDDAREELRRFDPDLVHIATPDFSGTQAMLFSARLGKPVVSSYHTHFTSYLSYYSGMSFLEKPFLSYLRWFYNNCVHTYVPSESMIEELRNYGFKNDLRIWARGIQTEVFNPGRRSDDWRKSKGINPDDIVVTMVSRLVWEKEMETLRSVFKKLNESGRQIRTLIVGEGPAREVLETSLGDTIFTGHLTGDDLAIAYASSDIFMFPSISETFGNVTLEALASGVPAVEANAQGNKSLVKSGYNGYLATPKDANEFERLILKLANNPVLRNQFAQNAVSFAQTFAWDNILDKLVQDYHEAIHSFARR
ncbi:MAG: glycosyltransferase family 1 protein [Balneolales bacterium]|nr:glycosyltransferase family 1 protein [Balneolales bacterium]